ncbi:MAG: DNA methyltransferase [Bacteroidales bacterium]|nr:DNA methyltransferase [Bacteroidales bacterium]
MIKDIHDKNGQVQAGDRELNVLKETFPQCFDREGRFDKEAFLNALPDGLEVTDETSGFNWLGKNYARMLYNMDSTTVICPDKEHNDLPENCDSQNVYISGDNLDALQHLVKSYSGQIKVIYIDPPYNTGSDGFVYNDKFNFTAEGLAGKLGVTTERAERILSMTRRGSASHAAWLTFMLPRLSFARDLLTKDGVIFISIDDNEQANLKCLCDEVFGEDSYIATFPWRKRTAKSDVPFGISQDYEWVLAYAKSEEYLAGIDGKNRKYYETPDFPGRPWRVHDMTTQKTAIERPNSFCTIVNPKTGNEYPANPKRTWCVTADTFAEYYEKGKIVFPGEYDFLNIDKPVFRYWKEDDMKKAGDRFGLFTVSTMLPNDVGMSQDGTKDFDALFDAKLFGFPKPVNLIKHFIDASVTKDQDEPFIVLDFFSGSATTAQAIMELNNADDGYNLNYILVQLPELCKEDSEAFKAGYRTIDQIGMERIKRAAVKIKTENPLFAGDLGFKHFTLKEAPRDTLDKLEKFDPNTAFGTDTILSDFGTETVLRTWLVADGYGFTADATVLKLGNYEAYCCDKHLYLINPEEDFNEESMAALIDLYQGTTFSPQNVVVFGYSFGTAHRVELDSNLRSLNSGNKSLQITIDVRY